MQDAAKFRKLGYSWVLCVLALGLHVFDEATTGFLDIYNPTVTLLRSRWGWFPMPTFGYTEWLAGLVLFCIFLLVLSPLAFARNPWFLFPATVFAGLMILNGCGHILFSILGRTVAGVTFPRPAPGFWSSPLLIAASAWFLAQTRKSGRTLRALAAGI